MFTVHGEISPVVLPVMAVSVFPTPAVSVEDCLVAVDNEVGALNGISMNKAAVVVLFHFVDQLTESGLMINDVFFPVLPLSNPSKKVVLSNVPP